MKTDQPCNRRQLLGAAAATIGGIGAAAAAFPVTRSFLPSEKARALGADVKVDISDLDPGKLRIVRWRGMPVWILRRTPEMLRNLETFELRLKDPSSEVSSQQPDYARNKYRSINPEYLVVVGICTHLGCSPNFFPERDPEILEDWWQGGFFCPCHQSEYDLAGRVFKGRSPAPMNLPVPPHKYLSETVVVIGDLGDYG